MDLRLQGSSCLQTCQQKNCIIATVPVDDILKNDFIPLYLFLRIYFELFQSILGLRVAVLVLDLLH
jgi:hypothetical protein